MAVMRTWRSLKRAVDGIPAHSAVLDHSGSIVAVNEAWLRFGHENGLRPEQGGVGTSYLRVCEAEHARSTEGPSVATAIRRVLGGSEEPFRSVYSCHGPARASWFQVEVASLRHRGSRGALVTHARVDESVVRREIADAERRHIARELHDTTAQNLASALMDLELLARAQREAQGVVSEPLAEAIALCERSLGEVRSLSYELAPPGFVPGRLVESLKTLAATFARRTGLAVMLLTAPIAVADEEVTRDGSKALYRVAEESLHNARRHSGGRKVSLRIDRAPGGIRLEVKDDGHGIAPGAEAGKGLSDMRDRIEACGGHLEISSTRDGTVLVASVPAGEGNGDAVDRHRR